MVALGVAQASRKKFLNFVCLAHRRVVVTKSRLYRLEVLAGALTIVNERARDPEWNETMKDGSRQG
jgi:hypothetical protein